MAQIDRAQPMREPQPLEAVTVIDLVAFGQKSRIDGTVGSIQIDDRTVQELPHFLVRVFLGVVVEAELGLIDRLADDDLAVEIRQLLPAPRLQDVSETENIPALLGLRDVHHVDEVLSEGPVPTAPLLTAVVAAGIVSHATPGRCRRARQYGNPLLGV